MTDGSCPCVAPNCTGGCSGGQIDSYTSAKQTWGVKTCNGAEAPANGCVDFWGNKVQDPRDCWFGRGATQLTWPGNYNAMQELVQAAANVDICADPDSICKSDKIAWFTAIVFWMQHDSQWIKTHTFDQALAILNPQDTSSNPERKALYKEYMAAANITPPPAPPPPPSKGTTTVQSLEGCWQIANRVCPGKGNSYKTVICDPQRCSPAPALGQTVTYNCNGC